MPLYIVVGVLRTETSARVSGVAAPIDGITTGTSLDSSFPSVLMVASVHVTFHVHQVDFFFACLLPPLWALLVRWNVNSDWGFETSDGVHSSTANIGFVININILSNGFFFSFKWFISQLCCTCNLLAQFRGNIVTKISKWKNVLLIFHANSHWSCGFQTFISVLMLSAPNQT